MEFKNLAGIAIILLLSTNNYGHAQKNDCKCCSENYHQFDFWPGDWNVYNTLGNKVGENLEVSMQGRCVLLGNWMELNILT